jgi:hypothetical protein
MSTREEVKNIKIVSILVVGLYMINIPWHLTLGQMGLINDTDLAGHTDNGIKENICMKMKAFTESKLYITG